MVMDICFLQGNEKRIEIRKGIEAYKLTGCKQSLFITDF